MVFSVVMNTVLSDLCSKKKQKIMASENQKVDKIFADGYRESVGHGNVHKTLWSTVCYKLDLIKSKQHG